MSRQNQILCTKRDAFRESIRNQNNKAIIAFRRKLLLQSFLKENAIQNTSLKQLVLLIASAFESKDLESLMYFMINLKSTYNYEQYMEEIYHHNTIHLYLEIYQSIKEFNGKIVQRIKIILLQFFSCTYGLYPSIDRLYKQANIYTLFEQYKNKEGMEIIGAIILFYTTVIDELQQHAIQRYQDIFKMVLRVMKNQSEKFQLVKQICLGFIKIFLTKSHSRIQVEQNQFIVKIAYNVILYHNIYEIKKNSMQIIIDAIKILQILLLRNSINIFLQKYSFTPFIELLIKNNLNKLAKISILKIIGHLSYVSEIEIVKVCKNTPLINILWKLLESFKQEILIILGNLALYPELHKQIDNGAIKIAVLFLLEQDSRQNKLEILRFLSNWAKSKCFRFTKSEQDLLKILSNNTNIFMDTLDQQIDFWVAMYQHGYRNVPYYILEQTQNDSIRDIDDFSNNEI